MLVIVAGRGQVQFDRTAAVIDAATIPTIDADVDAPGVAPIHRYRLAGSYVDDFGGPSIDPLGGGFTGDGYKFAVNQGLGLSNAVPVTADLAAL